MGSATLFCKMFTSSPPSSVCAPKISRLKLSYNISERMLYNTTSFNCNGSIRSPYMAAVACSADDSGPREENKALETVLNLYEAIKNKNINQLSDVIAEECLCVSNLVSAFQPFLGKKQVLTFFTSLMKNLGNKLHFVVQHTVDDGMVVGVSWKLEWTKVPLHLGKGFSLYTCHVYQGKVMIKNVEIFLEPILHIEPLRMVSLQSKKLISLIMTAMEKINPQAMLKNKTRKAIIVLVILLFPAAIVFLLKYRMPT